MTVQELIDELNKIEDKSQLVLISGPEETISPCVNQTEKDFKFMYWDDENKPIYLPENTTYVEL